MTAPLDAMTASDIAKLADVDISTVSNWRKRYKDKEPRFPAPLDENAVRPVFAGHEVRAWLRQQSPKYAALVDEAQDSVKAPDLIKSWRYALNSVFMNPNTDVRLDELTLMFIARLQGNEFRYSKANRAGYTNITVSALAEHLTVTIPDEAVDGIEAFFADLVSEVPLDELIEAAAADLDHSSRWRRSTEAADAGDNLRALLAELVHSESASVLDFACGTGGLLTAVAAGLIQGDVVGVEQDWVQASIADARLAPYRAEIIDGNILTDDLLDGRTFDAVVSIPPFGLKLPADTNSLARRLPYGQVRGTADAAWLQLAVNALAPGGEAYLVLPGHLTTDAKSDVVRRELVRQGLVAAVLSLPPGAHPDLRIATDIWVLRRPREARQLSDVLFIDASDTDPTSAGAYDAVVQPLAHWLDGLSQVPATVPAVAVSPLDLMEQTVNLSPRYWVTRAQQVADPHDAIAAVTGAFDRTRRAKSHLDEVSVTDPPLRPTSHVSLRKLRDDGRIELIRPNLRAREAGADEATARLTVGVAEAMRAGTFVASDTSDDVPSNVGRDNLTRELDVLVWADQHDRRVRATVCSQAGLSVVGPVHVIRCHDVNPQFLALCLESQRNAALVTGATSLRPQLLDMEIPYATAAQMDAAADTVRLLRTLEMHAREILSASAEARTALADTLGSGQVEIAAQGGPDGA